MNTVADSAADSNLGPVCDHPDPLEAEEEKNETQSARLLTDRESEASGIDHEQHVNNDSTSLTGNHDASNNGDNSASKTRRIDPDPQLATIDSTSLAEHDDDAISIACSFVSCDRGMTDDERFQLYQFDFEHAVDNDSSLQ